jgi:hypothetical protein
MTQEMYTVAEELYKRIRNHIENCDNPACCVRRYLLESLELE